MLLCEVRPFKLSAVVSAACVMAFAFCFVFSFLFWSQVASAYDDTDLELDAARVHRHEELINSSTAVLSEKRQSQFSGSATLMETMGITAAMGSSTSVRTRMAYAFDRPFAFGFEGSYRQPFGDVRSDYNGLGDATFFIEDRDLYSNHDASFHLSAELGYVVPYSDQSARSSLGGGAEGTLIARQYFGRWVLSAATTLGRYFFDYDTGESNGNRPATYNAPYAVKNSLALSAPLAKAFKWVVAGSVRTSLDYSNSTGNIYGVSTGSVWNFDRDFAISAGVRSTQNALPKVSDGSQDTSSSSSDGGDTANGNLFDASTTSFYTSLNVRF